MRLGPVLAVRYTRMSALRGVSLLCVVLEEGGAPRSKLIEGVNNDGFELRKVLDTRSRPPARGCKKTMQKAPLHV